MLAILLLAVENLHGENMVAWSSIAYNTIRRGIQLRSCITGSKNKLQITGINYVPVRCGGHGPRSLEIRETMYSLAKFKDYLFIYIFVTGFPMLLLVLYTNIFIGKAKLAVIPEGYEPKHWEYYRHPITQFLAKHFIPSRKEQHERNLHLLYEKKERQMITSLQKKVENLMKERDDYQSWYTIAPAPGKYLRQENELTEEFLDTSLGRYKSGFHV